MSLYSPEQQEFSRCIKRLLALSDQISPNFENTMLVGVLHAKLREPLRHEFKINAPKEVVADTLRECADDWRYRPISRSAVRSLMANLRRIWRGL